MNGSTSNCLIERQPSDLFYVFSVRVATLLKKDFDAGVFQWILLNFKNTFLIEHLRAIASNDTSANKYCITAEMIVRVVIKINFKLCFLLHLYALLLNNLFKIYNTHYRNHTSSSYIIYLIPFR